MAAFRLKVSENDFQELHGLALASWPKESGAFALAGMAKHRGGTDIIVRRPIAVPRQHFTVQHQLRLELSSAAINGLVALCESNGLGAVLVHSHPEDIPYSLSDDFGEERIFEVLRRFIPDKAPTASLVFNPDGVRGRVWLPGRKRPEPISQILVIGRSIRRKELSGPEASAEISPSPDVFDRQVRAFGSEGQALIATSRVGIVGVGGTGSPTAEQLVRMGVRDIVLVDHDQFEPSNITRMYGTFSQHTKKSRWPWRKQRQGKVDIVSAHLRRISPDACIRTMAKNIVLHDAAAELLDRDVIFLCTDDHWGRSIVNQVAYQYFIPTINLGMRIDAKDGRISGAFGSVDVLRPDVPCLWCRQSLHADRIAAESMPCDARSALEREGYYGRHEIVCR